jgi:hypothetical protein
MDSEADKIFEAKYEDVSVEMGDEIGLIVMQVKMDRIDMKVILTQPKNVDRIITAIGVDKGAPTPTPALANVMGDDDTSPLLQNQKQFMSLNSLLMFIGQRTNPEIRPAVIKLSTKYNKATELETHQLILAPKSLKMVCSADASYAEHADGKSHSVELWILSQRHAAILLLYHANNLKLPSQLERQS